MSSILSQFIDGFFSNLEKNVVPYRIGHKEFRYMYILIDGIYPHLSCFVHCIKQAIQEKDKVYIAWQEGAIKDNERAFGMMQSKWQFLARPMHQLSLQQIGCCMQSCMILHNMCVSNRVMEGDVRA